MLCCAATLCRVVSCSAATRCAATHDPSPSTKEKKNISLCFTSPASLFIKEQIRKVYEKIVPSIFWSSILALLIISKPKNTATFVKSDHY